MSSLSSINSFLPEWEAKKAVSTSGNKCEGPRATAINWSSWGLFSRLIVAAFDRWGVLTKATVSTSSGHFDGGVGSESMCHSGGWYGSTTALGGNSLSDFIFADGRRIPMRAPVSMRSGYCTGKIESSKKVTKSLLFLLSNKLADLLCLELLEL